MKEELVDDIEHILLDKLAMNNNNKDNSIYKLKDILGEEVKIRIDLPNKKNIIYTKNYK